uniref:Putative secreted protein n=1 Tax=Anopheles marajoara TaxID=58244 RepID=A0A2M4C7K8_9DIPT
MLCAAAQVVWCGLCVCCPDVRTDQTGSGCRRCTFIKTGTTSISGMFPPTPRMVCYQPLIGSDSRTEEGLRSFPPSLLQSSSIVPGFVYSASYFPVSSSCSCRPIVLCARRLRCARNRIDVTEREG